MRLKRLYAHAADGTPTTVRGIRVLRASERQHFSPGLIDGGIREGWLSMGQGRLTLHGEAGDVVYQLVRTPGAYCCHCDARIEDASVLVAPGFTRGRQHVAQAHPGVASPDPTSPAGYRVESYYTGVNLSGAVDVQTPAEAAALDKQIRDALVEKLRQKYGARAIRPIAGGADLVFNIAKGRVAELYNRVDLSDPTNAVLVIVLLAASGIESDGTLRDKDSLSDLVSGATNEATNTGYARKVLSDSDIAAFAPDDTNDRVDLDIPDQTWTGVANDGTGAISDFVVCYDSDSTGGADSAIVPLTLHDFSVTPDGSDITAQIAAAGFFRAS
jgi:hypothetical protein